MLFKSFFKFFCSAIIVLAMLYSCNILGLGLPIADDGNEGGATYEEAALYAMLVIESSGMLFSNFKGEDGDFTFRNSDYSAVVTGSYDANSSDIDYTIKLNEYSNGEDKVTVTTNYGEPIEVSGNVKDGEGILFVYGTAILGYSDYNSVSVDLTVEFTDDEDPDITGSVLVDDKEFDAFELEFDFGDNNEGDGGEYTIEDLSGTWEVVGYTEFRDDGSQESHQFPLDLAYMFTYDNENDLPGNSDIDGDGAADTYEYTQCAQLDSDGFFRIYHKFYLDKTNPNVTVQQMVDAGHDIADTGTYYLSGHDTKAYINEDGQLTDDTDQLNNLEISFDEDEHLILENGKSRSILRKISSTSGVEVFEDTPEYNLIAMMMDIRTRKDAAKISMECLAPMKQLKDNFDIIADNTSFSFQNTENNAIISGIKNYDGNYTATISLVNAKGKDDMLLNGTIRVSGRFSSAVSSASFSGSINVSNSNITKLELNFSIIMLSETEMKFNGYITLDDKEFYFNQYVLIIDV